MSTLTYRGASWVLGLGYAASPRAVLRSLHGALARQASRRALARLDDRLLADVGLTREQAAAETVKRFWMR